MFDRIKITHATYVNPDWPNNANYIRYIMLLFPYTTTLPLYLPTTLDTLLLTLSAILPYPNLRIYRVTLTVYPISGA